jgi:hypothetical protein
MKITTTLIGSIWHGTLEGHPEVDERALTEEMARIKVERIVARLPAGEAGPPEATGQRRQVPLTRRRRTRW